MDVRRALGGWMIGLGLACCGGEHEEAAPRSTAEAVAPAAAPAPAASPAISRCTRGELVEVATSRARPHVVLGEERVAIRHRARRRATPEDTECPPWITVSVSTLPMRAGAFEETSTSPVCGSDTTGSGSATIGLDVSRDGDELYLLRCTYDDGGRSGEDDVDPWMGCSQRMIGGEDDATNDGFGIRTTYGLPFDLAHVRLERLALGELRLFVAAISGMGESSGVFGVVTTPARSVPMGRIGFAPSGDVEDDAAYAFEALPRSEGGFVLTHGPRRGPRRTRVPFEADGFAGEHEVYEGVVTPPAFDVVVERGEHRAPPRLRIARNGVLTALTGPSETEGAFAPSFVHVGERLVLTWSEGLDDATRIRAAVLDPERGSLVGAIVDLSTPGAEAGYATIDAHGERVIATWDEKADGRWRVVASELRCE